MSRTWINVGLHPISILAAMTRFISGRPVHRTLHGPDEESPHALAKENLVIELQRMIQAKKHCRKCRYSRIGHSLRGTRSENGKQHSPVCQGNGAARFWIAMGQPKLRVAGKIVDGDKTVFIFEVTAAALPPPHSHGGFMSDVDIQLEDIRSMTTDLTDVMAVVAGKYQARN